MLDPKPRTRRSLVVEEAYIRGWWCACVVRDGAGFVPNCDLVESFNDWAGVDVLGNARVLLRYVGRHEPEVQRARRRPGNGKTLQQRGLAGIRLR